MSNILVRGAGGGGGKGGGSGGHESDDTLFSTAYIEAIFALNDGEIEGLVNGSKSIYLDDTPITASDGVQNHRVAWDMRLGTPNQDPFSTTQNVSSEHTVNIKVEKATPHVELISDTEADIAVITLAFPRLMSVDDKGNVNGTSLEFLIECQAATGSYIPVSRNVNRTNGVHNSGSDYYQSPDKTFSAEIFFNSNTSDDPLVYSSNDGVTFSLLETVKMLSNNLSYNNISANHNWQYSASTTVTFNTESVQYLRVPANSSVAWFSYSSTGNIVINGKCSAQAQRQYRFPLQGAGGWNIRVTRITDDSTSNRLFNELWISSLRTEKVVRLNYPNTALLYVKIPAKEFSSPPKVRAELLCKRIKVPTNYDTLTRSYTGVWDGTFKIAYSNNPAWVLYDVAINDRYGLGQYVKSTGFDKWTLYQVAQYCDGLVDSGRRNNDGSVILEPRFTFNAQLDLSQNEAYTLLKNLCSVFRGMIYVVNGALTAKCDEPSDYKMLFNQTNVIRGKFEFSGSAGLARKSVALVQWNDPSNLYIADTVRVDNQEKLLRYGYRATEVVAFACTSRGQAHRLGKWLLLDGEIVTFSVGHDSAFIEPNDLIQCMIPLRNQGKRLGGRLKAVDGVTITLDSTVTLILGHNYLLSVLLADGSIAEQSLVVSSGETDSLTMASPLSGAVVDKARWVLEDLDGIQATAWRVLSINENDNRTGFVINALSHHNAYDAIDNFNIPIDSALLPSINPIAVDAVSNISAELAPFTDKNGLIQNGIMLNWTQVMQAQSYSVRHRLNDSNWMVEPLVFGNHFEMAVKDGDYDFEVVAINALGKRSAPVAASVTITGDATDIASFSAIISVTDP